MDITSINISVTKYLYGLASLNIWTEYLAIFFSDAIFVIAILAYLISILPLRKSGEYFKTLISDMAPAVATGLTVFIMKMFVTADRPFVQLGFTPFVAQPDPHSSFPSFHAAAFASFAMTLLYHRKKLGVYLIALLPLVMIGRIAIGVHWLSDVLFGAFIGIGISFRYYFKNYKSKVIAEKIINKYFKKEIK